MIQGIPKTTRCLVVAALLASATMPVPARTMVKLATVAPDGSIWHETLKEMSVDWKSVTDGEVVVRIYAGGVAGDEPDMVRKMRIGQLQAASLSVIGLAQIDPAFQVFSIPLFFDSYEELYYVMDRLEPVIKQRLADKGFVMVNWGFGGWVHIFTKEPVRRIDDLRKVKMFASAGDDAWVQWWKERGFRPVPLATTDILTGLQTGMIEGLPATPLASLSLQWFRQTPNMLDLGLAPLVGATVITEKAWSRIDGSQRAALVESAKATEQRLKDEVPSQDREAVEEMKKRGLTVVAAEAHEGPGSWQAEAEELAKTMRAGMVPKEIYDLAFSAREEYRRTHADSGAGR